MKINRQTVGRFGQTAYGTLKQKCMQALKCLTGASRSQLQLRGESRFQKACVPYEEPIQTDIFRKQCSELQSSGRKVREFI